jgi:hypothetical protein
MEVLELAVEVARLQWKLAGVASPFGDDSSANISILTDVHTAVGHAAADSLQRGCSVDLRGLGTLAVSSSGNAKNVGFTPDHSFCHKYRLSPASDFVHTNKTGRLQPINFSSVCSQLAAEGHDHISRDHAQDMWDAVVRSIGYLSLGRIAVSLDLPPLGQIGIAISAAHGPVYAVCCRSPHNTLPRILQLPADAALRNRRGGRSAWHHRPGFGDDLCDSEFSKLDAGRQRSYIEVKGAHDLGEMRDEYAKQVT